MRDRRERWLLNDGLAGQNLEAWEEAKAEIEKIPEHPNRLPDDGTNGSTGVAHGRRDSMATAVEGRP